MRFLLLFNSFSNKWSETREAKDSNQMLMKIVHNLWIVSVRMVVISKSKYCGSNLILLFNNNQVKSFKNRITSTQITLLSHKMRNERMAMEFFLRLITFSGKKKLPNLILLLFKSLRKAGKSLKRISKKFGWTLLC